MRIALLLVLAVAACKQPNADATYFGKAVAPPHGLGKVKLGMTEAEARAAGVTEIRSGALGVPSDVRDVELYVALDRDAEPRVALIELRALPPAAEHLRAWLTEAWGPPVPGRDVWQGDAWRALLRAEGDEMTVEFWPALTPAAWGRTPGALPADLVQVKAGMTKHERESAAPRMRGVWSADNTSIVFFGEDDPGGLREIGMFLDTDHAQPALLAAWGDGKVEPETGDMAEDFTAVHTYYDAASGWRATLHAAKPDKRSRDGIFVDGMLDFAAFTPLVKLLGSGPEVAVLAADPFGKTLAEARGHGYPQLLDNRAVLPVTELTRIASVGFVVDALGVIDTALVSLVYDAGGSAAIKAVLDAKWGTPAVRADGSLLYHKAAPYVAARDDGSAWQLVVRPTAPLPNATIR